MFFRKIGKGVLFASALALSFGAQADDYYKSGDEIVVLQGFQPGGGSDALAQLIQPYWAKELGVNFINRYQPGATGAIAWTQLARQTEADGRTISITNTPMLMTNYMMHPDLKYNIDDFDPIANIVTDPGVMVVKADSPYETMEELLDAARENPGTITVGNSGVGGDDFFSVIMIEKAADVKFRSVPFAGDGPSWQAALGGKIDASSNNLGITYPQIQAGNLRVLAIYSDERSPDLPDVPTLKELGIDVVNGSSRGYSAPKGIPEEARQQMIEALDRVIANPDFQADAKKHALPVDYKAGEDYGNFLKKQEADFSEIWEEIKDDYESDNK